MELFGIDLPVEIWFLIVKYVDQRSRLNLRKVCRKTNEAVVCIWNLQQSLYVHDAFYKNHQRRSTVARTFSDAYVQACILKNGFDFEFDRFLDFITVFMPRLQGISFRGCKLILTSQNLIDLAQRLPYLEYLDLGQKLEQPKLSPNCLRAVAYFRRLKSLNLDGLVWNSLQIKPIALDLFPRLERLSFMCTTGMLFRTIAVLKELDLQFPKLSKLRIGNRSWVTLNPSDLRLLHWFLARHASTLQHVQLQDFVFENERDITLIFQCLQTMPHLGCVVLDGCSCRQSIPARIYRIRPDKPKLVYKGWKSPDAIKHSIVALYMNV